MQDANVIAVRDARVGRIWLNRPKALNALDPGMLRGPHRAVIDCVLAAAAAIVD